MANAIQPVTFPEQISRILHNVRLGILEEMSGGDVHRRGELLLSIGPQLGIQLSQVSYNDDPALMVDLAPRYAFPVFFRTYTAQKVIDVIKDAINGFPIPNRPLWERAGREISTETVAQWFRENIPDDFSPLLPRDERVAEYLQHIMDQQTNTIKEEAIVAMLVKMQVFNR
jgi:hypothetical protein